MSYITTGAKFLGWDVKVYVQDPYTGSATYNTWVQIDYDTLGVSFTKADADVTTQIDGGWESNVPARRGASFTLSARTMIDEATGIFNDAQAVLLWLSQQISTDGLASFKFEILGKVSMTFTGSVNVSQPFGGSGTEGSPFQVEIRMTGVPVWAVIT